jgi:hypothetical protein
MAISRGSLVENLIRYIAIIYSGWVVFFFKENIPPHFTFGIWPIPFGQRKCAASSRGGHNGNCQKKSNGNRWPEIPPNGYSEEIRNGQN